MKATAHFAHAGVLFASFYLLAAVSVPRVTGTPDSESSIYVDAAAAILPAPHRTVGVAYREPARDYAEGSLEEDWRALVALYDATNGAGWNDNSNWSTDDTVVPSAAELASWDGVTLSGGRVTRLDLGWNDLNGTLPAELGNLTELQVLDLHRSEFQGAIPVELGNLTKLRELNLWWCHLQGPIPAELGNLTELEMLNLSNNDLVGGIPVELGNLTELRILNLSFNSDLQAIIPDKLGDLTKLQTLNLAVTGVANRIPAELGNLTALELLDLSTNNLRGRVPTELGFLTELQYLDLSGNDLISELPASLTNLTNLIFLHFDFNGGPGGPDLCAPLDGVFQTWLRGIGDRNGPNCAPAALAIDGTAPQDQVYLVGVTITDLTLPPATGGQGPYTYSLTPEPPPGLIFNPATRTVSGTPTQAYGKTRHTYAASDANGESVELPFSIEVNAATLGFGGEIQDQTYIEGQTIPVLRLPEATGGTEPYLYALNPNPPPGLVFSASEQTLSGTTTDVTHRRTYRYSATDVNGAEGNLTFSIEVVPSSFTLDGVIEDQTYTKGETIPVLMLPEARAGLLPYTYRLVPALPAGLSFDDSTRELSGTPTDAYPRIEYRYISRDATGASAELSFSIEVTSDTRSGGSALEIPADFLIHGTYPNPFHSTTRVEFDLPWRARITLEVFNLVGRRVLALPPRQMEAGWRHRLDVSGWTGLAGVYVYRIAADTDSRTLVRHGRMVLLR